MSELEVSQVVAPEVKVKVEKKKKEPKAPASSPKADAKPRNTSGITDWRESGKEVTGTYRVLRKGTEDYTKAKEILERKKEERRVASTSTATPQ